MVCKKFGLLIAIVDKHFMHFSYIFFYFSRKIGLNISYKLSPFLLYRHFTLHNSFEILSADISFRYFM